MMLETGRGRMEQETVNSAPGRHPAARVFTLYRADFLKLTAVAAAVWVPVRLIQFLMDMLLVGAGRVAVPGDQALLVHAPPGVLAPAPSAATPATWMDVAGFSAALLLWLVACTLVTGAAIYLTTARLQGSPVGAMTALRWVEARLRPALSARLRWLSSVVLCYCLASIGIALTAILITLVETSLHVKPRGPVAPYFAVAITGALILVPPAAAAVLAVTRSLALAVVLLEGYPASDCISRSSGLLYGQRRLALGILLLPAVLVLIGDGAIAASTYVAGGHLPLITRSLLYLVPGYALVILVLPILGVAQAVLYREAKAREDASDAATGWAGGQDPIALPVGEPA